MCEVCVEAKGCRRGLPPRRVIFVEYVRKNGRDPPVEHVSSAVMGNVKHPQCIPEFAGRLVVTDEVADFGFLYEAKRNARDGAKAKRSPKWNAVTRKSYI